MKYKKFEELPIWKLSLKLTKKVYDLTNLSRFSEDFKLRDQIRGAMISVSSNIVEGFKKNNNDEFIRLMNNYSFDLSPATTTSFLVQLI